MVEVQKLENMPGRLVIGEGWKELTNFFLPEELKNELRKCYGKVLSSLDEIKKDGRKLITVGDFTSYTLITHGIEPDIIVYDGKIRRKKVKESILKVLENYDAEKYLVRNPPSTIKEDLWNLIKECLEREKKCKIFVDGEEDLAAFVFIHELPVGSFVLYGLGENIVIVEVTPELKKKCKDLLKKFKLNYWY